MSMSACTRTLLVLALSTVAAACGGDDGGSGSGGGEASGGGTAAVSDETRKLFANTCGGCHALSDAGTDGSVGPNLDETSLDAGGVEATIEAGPGAMPPNLLEGEDRTAVAEYVASQAGQ